MIQNEPQGIFTNDYIKNDIQFIHTISVAMQLKYLPKWYSMYLAIYPNGKAAVTTSVLFFKSYPKVTPGSQIIVPEKPEVKKMSTGEFVSIAGVLASLAGVIIAILR